jgi:hypothetical protein
MNSLLQLPVKAAAFAARICMRLAEAAVEATSEWSRERPRASSPRSPSAPPPPPTRAAPVATEPPPPVAPPAPAPAEPPIDVVPDLTRGQAARIREEQREAETTEDSPGAEVHVDEPWRGYRSMKAPEIIDRLRVSDDAVKAIVLLYESSHRSRKTVLRAAGG